MLKLNVQALLKKNKFTNYVLYNKLNNIRATKGEKLMNYTNFQNMVNQCNKSVTYQDLEELCEAFECDISELLILKKEKRK